MKQSLSSEWHLHESFYGGVQDEFLFKVEGTGALDCSTIITTALDILCSKLRNLQYHINIHDSGAEPVDD